MGGSGSGKRRSLVAAFAFALIAAAVGAILADRPPSSRRAPSPFPEEPVDVSRPEPGGLPDSGEQVFGEEEEGLPVVRGRVVEEEGGAPVPGAELRVCGRDVVTGADGRFAVAAPIRDGRIESLEVGADGFRPWCQSHLPWAGESIEVRLARSARLVVRLVSAEDGNPVAGVPVQVSFGSLPDVPDRERRRTDGEGRAAFLRIPGRHIRLDACGNGWRIDPREVPEERRHLFLDPGEEREVTLPVVRTAVIRGRVVAATGEPVPGADVSCRSGRFAQRLRASESGTFALSDLLPAEYALGAGVADFQAAEQVVRVGPGEDRDLTLNLPPGGWLELEVRAEDGGGPLPGARVTAGPIRKPRSVEGRTDDAGRLRLGPLEPGPAVLEVSREGYRVGERAFDLHAGETTRVALVLDRGRSLAGRVELPDGTPVEGCRVGWYGGSDFRAKQTARTVPGGAFELEGLPDGRLEIQASWRDPGGRRWRCSRWIASGAAGALLTLEREATGGLVSTEILVTGPGGVPVARAEALVVGLGADGAVLWEHEVDVVAGRAAVERSAKGATRLRVWISGARSADSRPLPAAAAAGRPVPLDRERIEILLPPERVVTGAVRGPTDRMLPRVELEALVEPWPGAGLRTCWNWAVTTEPEGAFRIGGLPEGEVELVVWPPAGLVHSDPVRVRAGARDVVIDLDREAEVVVEVVDRSGRPVKDIWVDALQESGIGDDPNEGWTACDDEGRTGRDGTVRLGGLAASASYRLLCRRADVSVPLAPVRIDGWRPQDTTVRLVPALSISGRAACRDGRPFDGEGGSIWCWNRVTGWDSIPVDPDGTFEEPGLPPGPVALVWTPFGTDPRDDPEVGPLEFGHPVRWVRAGDAGIVFEVPLD